MSGARRTRGDEGDAEPYLTIEQYTDTIINIEVDEEDYVAVMRRHVDALTASLGRMLTINQAMREIRQREQEAAAPQTRIARAHRQEEAERQRLIEVPPEGLGLRDTTHCKVCGSLLDAVDVQRWHREICKGCIADADEYANSWTDESDFEEWLTRRSEWIARRERNA